MNIPTHKLEINLQRRGKKRKRPQTQIIGYNTHIKDWRISDTNLTKKKTKKKRAAPEGKVYLELHVTFKTTMLNGIN